MFYAEKASEYTGMVNAVQFSPDGRLVAALLSSGDDQIALYDPSTGEPPGFLDMGNEGKDLEEKARREMARSGAWGGPACRMGA